jgi:hypothetical protein
LDSNTLDCVDCGGMSTRCLVSANHGGLRAPRVPPSLSAGQHHSAGIRANMVTGNGFGHEDINLGLA